MPSESLGRHPQVSDNDSVLGEPRAQQRSRLKIQCWELADRQQIEDEEPAKDAKENIKIL